MICEWDTARYLIFSTNAEPLIHYSHLTAIAIFLGLLGFTFLKLKQWPVAPFRLMALAYIAWLFFDLILWSNENIQHVLFFWTLINLVEPLIFIFAFAYFFNFVEGRPISLKSRWLIFALVVPTLIMAPTSLSVVGFDYTTCDRDVVEGIAAYYNYFLEFLFLLLLVGKGTLVFLRKSVKGQRARLVLVTLGTSLLMISFLVANFLGTVTGDYITSQYGHIAVPFFGAFLAYIAIKYESFEPRILLIDTLVVTLLILLLSMLFAETTTYQIYANALSFVIFVPLSYTLVTTVRRETRARRQVELLASELEVANTQQTTLIRFITHQLKGYMAKSRNIFSLMQEGDFGPVPEPMKEIVSEGFRSSSQGAQTIQEILNASNIKSGKVVYAQEPYDFAEVLRAVVAGLKPNAAAKGVELTLVGADESLMHTGDRMQMENALRNLIDNSIKYTLQGSVTMTVERKGAIRLSIRDTGVGITPDDMKNLFTEGGHGKNSQKVNVDSTGFGLYIVKRIVEAHKGRVWAESEGEGKGATFTMELPLT
jgi:signal transduction histidine kinase